MLRSITVAAAVLASVVLIWPTEANAFCRTTTCEPDRQSCERDTQGCLVDGYALRWPDRCIEIGLDLQSAANVGFDPAAIQALVATAQARWSNASCGNGTRPGLCLVLVPACGPVDAPITVHFRDATGMLASADVLAASDVRFADDGTIEHVSIEVNAGDQPLTLGDTDVGYDLLATLIHELGHAIGLDHSPHMNAAMYDQPRLGELVGRELSDDDRAAVCAVYPPSAATPVPASAVAQNAAPLECMRTGATPARCSIDVPGGARQRPSLLALTLLVLAYRRRRGAQKSARSAADGGDH